MSTNNLWRKSSFSGSNSTCVELAEHHGDVLIRNSNRPSAGTVALTREQLAGWIHGIKAGEFDDLT